MKALLVGEDNPYGADPRYALWCQPRHSAGGRLCYDVLGVKDQVDYVRRFDRANLCSAKWSMPEARSRADQLCSGPHAVHVLLGSKVSRAYGYAFKPFTIERRMTNAAVTTLLNVPHKEWTFVMLPHPSGRNRMWNEPGAIEKARSVLKEAGAL